MEEKKKRNHLIAIISAFLKTNIALMEYYKDVATDRKSKLVCTKSIKETEIALAHLHAIKHIELLDYLYSSFIGNNVIAYSVSGKIVNAKKLKEWDTDEHFQEFLDEMETKKKEKEDKEREMEENKIAIKQAKEQGKDVQMVYDKEKKRVVPRIIDKV